MRRTSHIIDRLVHALVFLSEELLGATETRVFVYDHIESETHSSEITAFYLTNEMMGMPGDTFAISISSIRNLVSDVDDRTGDLYLLAIAIHEMRHRLQTRTSVDMLNPSFFLPREVSRQIWKSVRVYPSIDIPFELDAFTVQNLFQLVAHYGPRRGYRDLEILGSEMLAMRGAELKRFAQIT